MTPLKIVLISIVLPLIYACSHPIEIEGDGYVWSTDGRTCRMEGDDPGKTNCSKNLVLGEYHTTYYAEPRDNWKFDYWEIYCEEAIDNSCSFSASKAAVQKFWFKTVPPLHAVFSPLDTDIDGLLDDVDPCPLNPNSSPCAVITTADTIAVAGKKWAQPDLFTGVSWNTLNGVCPGGVCGNSATLNGKDLSGWTWASVDDLNDLFNVYIAPAAIGPGPARYEFINSTVTPAVFAPPQGLRATDSDLNFNRVKAWTSTEAPGGAYYGFVYDGPSDDNDIFATDELVSPDTADLVVGDRKSVV